MSEFKHLNSGSPEKIVLQALRNNVTKYLSTEVLLHFTDHGLGHSDRMVTIVDDLIQPIQDSVTKLLPSELTALYAACYLHDLGMHVEKLDGLRCVPSDWASLSKSQQQAFIRDNHHVISAEIIVKAVERSGPCSTLNLDDVHPEQVACLCEAHNLWLERSADAARYAALTKEASGMRMDLLASLLRLADILDESQTRACLAKSKTLALDLPSRKHWWRHYYTDHIAFSQADHTITLDFRFPEGKDDEYSGLIPELQYPQIAVELAWHTGVLVKNACSWHLQQHVQTGPFSTKEPMPAEVQCSMLADLQRRRDERQERERIVALTVLREARPLIAREAKELDEKKGTLSPKEFTAAALDLYRKLWLAGGKRIAWMTFGRIYDENKEALPDDFRLDCECQLSAWKRECGFAFTSVGQLQQLQPKAEKLALSDQLRFRFYQELYLGLRDLGIHYPQAVEAGENALACAPSEPDRRAILADMAEMSFLVAEPAAALALLSKHEGLYASDVSHNAIRCRLLKWRLTAMRGISSTVIPEIDAFVGRLGKDLNREEKVRCMLLKAELLRLSGNLPGASAVFRDQLWAEVCMLPLDSSITVASCYQDVAMNAFEQKPLIGFYELVDERMTANVGFEEETHALCGLDAAAADKHYDALPHFLIAARTMYQQDNWPGLCNAFRRLASESIAIKSLHDAAFYAVLARSKDLAKTVVKAMEDCTENRLLERSIATLLEFAHLPLHAETACTLIDAILDEVPDATLPNVVLYLLKCTDMRTEAGFSTTTVSEAAWSALTSIADRLDIAVAQQVADAILSADLAKQNVVLRQKLSLLLIRLVTKLQANQVEKLIEEAVLMITVNKHDMDFREALILLATIASHAPSERKQLIAQRVYPNGTCNNNGLLLQLAGMFDVKPTSLELNNLADRLIQRLSSEVLIIPLTAELPKFNGSSHARIVAGNRVVTYETPVPVLWGVVRHIHAISPEKRSSLLTALLSNLVNQEDSIMNKLAILGLLPDFLAACIEDERKYALSIVAKVASDATVTPTGIQTAEEASHPLQRFRFCVGTPDQLQGEAIYCLAHLVAAHPDQAQGVDLQKILENGFASGSEEVRQRSFKAAQTNVQLSDRTRMQVLIGTRDESPGAAATAFYVFTNNNTINLPSIAEFLCYSLRYAVRSPDKELRQACAMLIVRLTQESLDQPLIQEVAQLAQILRQDRSWTVRKLFGHENSVNH